MVPTKEVLLGISFVANDKLVKQLSVVTVLPQPIYDSISFRTTNSPKGTDNLIPSFPKQGNAFTRYLLFTSDAN